MTSIALLFVAASTTFNLPYGLLSALCYVESNHNVAAHNAHDGNSPSCGVCQIKLNTARQMGYTGDEDGLKDPRVNVRWAADYLANRLAHYNGDIVRGIAAYNSGTYRVNKKGVPINLKYVIKVLTAWSDHK